MILGGDSYEYPIWYMLQDNTERIDSVWVSKETNQYEDVTYKPDCILVMDISDDRIEVHDREYKRVTDYERTNFYIP